MLNTLIIETWKCESKSLPKCEFCGKDVDLPFRCTYCRGYFCTEHKHPENHQCPTLPTSPYFWYRKSQRYLELRTPDLPIYCPKCGSQRCMTSGYNEKAENFECLDCRFKWQKPQTEFSYKEAKKKKQTK